VCWSCTFVVVVFVFVRYVRVIFVLVVLCVGAGLVVEFDVKECKNTFKVSETNSKVGLFAIKGLSNFWTS